MPPERYRVFFALVPDAATRARIAALDRSLPAGGRRVPVANYHITLAFIGAADEDRLACLCTAAHGLDPGEVRLELEHLGSFARAGVLWLGTGRVPSALLAFRERLVQRLAGECGCRSECRPWVPHVTLRRRWPRRQPLPAISRPLRWHSHGFALLVSEPCDAGVRYWPAAVLPRR